MVISVALIGILSLAGGKCLPDRNLDNSPQEKVASPLKTSSPIIWVTIQEEVDGKLVAGEGSLLIDGDVEDLKPQKSEGRRKAVPIVGGKFFVLKGKPGSEEYAITTLVYHSFRLKKTFFLPPTGVSGSLSPLKLKGQATIEIVIDAQGRVSVTVEEQKQTKSLKFTAAAATAREYLPSRFFSVFKFYATACTTTSFLAAICYI